MRIIREEHHALAAMLHALLFLVRGIRSQQMKPNFELMGALIYCIDPFPERPHHPKEDRWLFRLLLLRHPPARAVIDRLQSEHRSGATRIRQLEQALNRYAQGGDAEMPAFAEAAEDYVTFERNHMHTGEVEVFPLAQQYLRPDDWAAIDEALFVNTDPLHAVAVPDGFDELFRRIVNLARRQSASVPTRFDLPQITRPSQRASSLLWNPL
ncbi:MAG: hemerythrin domain-containing protein [Betaproteobacteria bacterium]